MKVYSPPDRHLAHLILSCVLTFPLLGGTVDSTNDLPKGSARLEAAERAQWHAQSLLEAYAKSGRKDPAWDKSVTNAFRAFAFYRATHDTSIDLHYLVLRFCRSAIDAGSDDPMIEYLAAREDDQRARSLSFDVKPAMRTTADALAVSGYSTIYKLSAAARAGARVKVWTGTGSEFPPEIQPYRKMAQQFFLEALADKSIPSQDIMDACNLFFNGLKGDDVAMEAAYKALEPALVKHRTNAWFQHQFKGRYYIHYAWGARGLGFGGSVNDKRWEQFIPRLQLAVAELESAWKLNPERSTVAADMIEARIGFGRGDAEMEQWFQRAMQADPHNYRACLNKLSYLEQNGDGFEEKFLAFGRQCALSTNWGGQVPLMLEKAHDTVYKYTYMQGRTNYWREEGVWDEVRAAYDKYFSARGVLLSRMPDVGTRSRLVRVAYRARKYDEMLNLLRGMKDIDVEVFGGRDAFASALAYANRKASRPIQLGEFAPEPPTRRAK